MASYLTLLMHILLSNIVDLSFVICHMRWFEILHCFQQFSQGPDWQIYSVLKLYIKKLQQIYSVLKLHIKKLKSNKALFVRVLSYI